jgi:hypothetical protein
LIPPPPPPPTTKYSTVDGAGKPAAAPVNLVDLATPLEMVDLVNLEIAMEVICLSVN